MGQCQRLLTGSLELAPGTSSFEAELAGAEGLVHGLAVLFSIAGIEGAPCDWYSTLLVSQPQQFQFGARKLCFLPHRYVMSPMACNLGNHQSKNNCPNSVQLHDPSSLLELRGQSLFCYK